MWHPQILADLARERQAELIAESRREALVREVISQPAARLPHSSSVRRAAVAVGSLLVTIVLFVRLPGHGA
jgi:hypothetical protein